MCIIFSLPACCSLMVSIARWRWNVSSFSCCSKFLRSSSSSHQIPTYLHHTSSNRHFDRCLERLQWSTEILHSLLGQETLTLGHVSRWVVVISQYFPVSLQWRHWYWRFGHLFLRCWFRLRCNICTSSVFSMHLFGQWRRSYPHVVMWSSSDRNSPTQSHPLSLLLHTTLSDLISRSPMGERFTGKMCSTSFSSPPSTHL